MPRIPTYLATLDYRPPRGDLATTATPGKALAKLGETAVGFAADIGQSIAAKAAKAQAEAAQKALKDKAAQAQGEAQLTDTSAQYLDAILGAARQTADDFEQHGTAAAMESYQMRVGQMRDELAETIADSEKRRQFRTNAQILADIRNPIVMAAQMRRLSAQVRDKTTANLASYLKAADATHYPIERDVIFDLAEREIEGKARAGFFTADEAHGLARGFYGDLARLDAERAIAQDPQAARADLEGDEAFPALGDEVRARLIDAAGRAVRAQAVHRETAAAETRRGLLGQFSAYLDSLRDGEPADEERFGRDRLTAVFGETEGARLWTEVEGARAAGALMETLRWASPAEIDERRSALASDPSRPEAAGDLASALTRREQQLHDKPADYVLANPRVAELHAAMVEVTAPPQVPPALTSALQAGQSAMGATPTPLAAAPPTAEDRRAATTAYANGTLAEQDRLGVPEDRRQVLPDATARDLAARIADGDPAEADTLLRDFADDWGEAWPRAFADLTRAGLPGELRLLADVDNPVAHLRFVEMLTAQAADPAALHTKAGGDAERIDGLVSTTLTSGTMGSGAAGSQSRPTQQVQSGTTPPVTRPLTYRGDSYPRRNAVDLHDSDGRPVISTDGDGNPQQIQVPEGVDLRMFARVGEEDNKLPGDIRGETILKRLENFVRGGVWDLQRPRLQKDNNGDYINYPEFVNAATLAIGIYCAAAGLTRQESLRAQQLYAIYARSDFGNAKRHWNYYPLPERNVLNTNLGYDLYAAGKIPGPAE